MKELNIPGLTALKVGISSIKTNLKFNILSCLALYVSTASPSSRCALHVVQILRECASDPWQLSWVSSRSLSMLANLMYQRYYSKRPSVKDPRLALLPPNLFTDARVLDVGCNEGWVTCEIGKSLPLSP